MSKQDMTPVEAQKALRELRQFVGKKCETGVVLLDEGGTWYADIRPRGYGAGQPHITIKRDTLAEVVAGLRDEAVNWIDQQASTITRKMALKIITITADQGACTDSALRMTGDFTDAEIAAHGTAACEEANRMAATGPFEIVATPSNQVAA